MASLPLMSWRITESIRPSSISACRRGGAFLRTRVRCGKCSLGRQRPAGALVRLVVGVVPVRTAAVAEIAGDSHLDIAAQLLAVVALLQLGMAGRTAPVALDALAGFAQWRGFDGAGGVWCWIHGFRGACDHAGAGRRLCAQRLVCCDYIRKSSRLANGGMARILNRVSSSASFTRAFSPPALAAPTTARDCAIRRRMLCCRVWGRKRLLRQPPIGPEFGLAERGSMLICRNT